MCGEKAQAVPRSRKHQFLVFKAQAERQKDLPLGIHAAVHPLLDAVNRSESHFGSSRELRLGHELVLTHLSDAIALKHTARVRRFGDFAGNRHRSIPFL